MASLTEPIPNPFREFNNMTYGISLYLQTHQQYAKMIETGKKDVTGYELIIQSGGISTNAGQSGIDDPDLGPPRPDRPGTNNFGAIRNKFFSRDFYLNDIQLQSYIAGTATGGPQNTFETSFTVTEPMGLTFMDRLYRASTLFAENEGIKNFNPVNQIYLMVVRFYGYDENGKQIYNSKFDDASDTNAFTEKWIPIMIRSIKFRVESSKVVYACECVCPQTQIGHGQVNGTIPFNLALQGETLQDLLDGEIKKNVKGVVSQGLMNALNEHQNTLASPQTDGGKKYEIANKYKIEMDPDIAKALTFAPGTSIISRGAMPGDASGKELSQHSTNSAKSVNNMQTYATNAGMKIVKFIDLAIRSSKYISDQYQKVNDANKDGDTKFKQKEPGALNWFKIRPKVKILGFDSLRQSWAYEITYYVSKYRVVTVNTKDFDTADCFKAHKEYEYWFTGKNTEVLKFEQDYNSFYYTTFSAKHKEDPAQNPKQQNNVRAMNVYRANSTESNQGGENLTSEQAANAASILYAPQDIANCEIDIVGDPDWLSQSEVFYAAAVKPGDAVLADGSVNYDRSEVFFTVNFNTVVDYDLDTGVADVTQNNLDQTVRSDGSFTSGVSQYAFIYRANTITSQFENGKFTQQLKGTLVFIPEACILAGDPGGPSITLADDNTTSISKAVDLEQANIDATDNFRESVSASRTDIGFNAASLNSSNKKPGFF